MTLKAFVTGGAGFIGSHIVDRLLEDKYEVTVLDNFSQGKLANIAHLRRDARFRYYRGDMTDGKLVAKLLRGYDVVFHVAAHANIRTSLVNHRADLDNNLIATLNVLDAMVKNNVDDLVFASSSAIYGEATVRPTPESYMPVQTSLYGASKLACEAYAQAFVQISDINFWAYRFSNVVGERCRRGVTWDFVHKLAQNARELEILGDGKQSKEYIHVLDCVEAMMVGYSKSAERINTFNIAVEENLMVDEIADLVTEEMELKGVKRSYTGGPRGWVGDNPIVHLSIAKLKSLGWVPKVSAREAVARTAKWTISQLSRA
ncbi:MAG TPA: NAD-dependent epimerase/dehydratase family protein [Candidatus Bathyarchaeia archaeon]|nr:NAD-dependent epimerase/dehydratase family protein [Candidatus Bathyarchaeia archaeon]